MCMYTAKQELFRDAFSHKDKLYRCSDPGLPGERSNLVVRQWSLSCAGHVLRRLDLSYLTHHRPLVWGDCHITR